MRRFGGAEGPISILLTKLPSAGNRWRVGAFCFLRALGSFSRILVGSAEKQLPGVLKAAIPALLTK